MLIALVLIRNKRKFIDNFYLGHFVYAKGVQGNTTFEMMSPLLSPTTSQQSSCTLRLYYQMFSYRQLSKFMVKLRGVKKEEEVEEEEEKEEEEVVWMTNQTFSGGDGWKRHNIHLNSNHPFQVSRVFNVEPLFPSAIL